MWFLILAGGVSLLAGVLFLFSPGTLHKLSNKINEELNKRFVPIDEKVYKMRVGVGISLLLVSVMLFFIAYYLAKKYGL